MIHIIYVSRAIHSMTEEELRFLLHQSRKRNKRQNITGLLLYVGNNFIQLLEGERRDVEDVYDSILKDNRNSGNIILLNEPIQERDFPNWSMGFQPIDKSVKNWPDSLSDFLEREYTPAQLAQSPTVIQLLYHFKEIHT